LTINESPALNESGTVKIAVVGLGHVGTFLAIPLARHNEVVSLDVLSEWAAAILARRAPVNDPDCETSLAEQPLDLRATVEPAEAYGDADFVIVATPTTYDPTSNACDTSRAQSVIDQVSRHAPEAVIVIRSTVPVGFTLAARVANGDNSIIFAPKLLCAGRALHDNLHPSRIVVGERSPRAETFARLMQQGALASDRSVLFTDSNEAEAIKLFANTYLAMRVV
jgi:UDPglucose 6-dehydrogenase